MKLWILNFTKRWAFVHAVYVSYNKFSIQKDRIMFYNIRSDQFIFEILNI